MFGQAFSRKHIAGALIASASICLSIALVSFVYFWHFVGIAAHADGKIIRMIENKDKGQDTMYFPVFSFRDTQGEQHTIHSSSGSFPPEYEVGDTVSVLYISDNPSNARINSFFSVWGITLFTGVIGLLDMPAGLIMWFWPNIHQRFKKKPETAAC